MKLLKRFLWCKGWAFKAQPFALRHPGCSRGVEAVLVFVMGLKSRTRKPGEEANFKTSASIGPTGHEPSWSLPPGR